VLEERRRWSVELLGWAASEDGLRCGVRVVGPVRARLDKLTVRFDLVDADGHKLDAVWKTIDVGGIERGTPTELFVWIPGSFPQVAQIGVDLVPHPTPEEARHLEELGP
jgi:hypothetical protein